MTDGERIKELRKALEIRQGDFAKKLSTTQGHISDIENGRKNLSDRTIKLICLEDWNGRTVNEDWLRTGEGEMFIKMTRDEEIAAFIGKALHSEEDSFKKRLISALSALNESDWETLEKLALSLVDKEKEQD